MLYCSSLVPTLLPGFHHMPHTTNAREEAGTKLAYTCLTLETTCLMLVVPQEDF